MNYLTVEKLSKSIGEKELFSEITFGLEKGQKTIFRQALNEEMPNEHPQDIQYGISYHHRIDALSP